MLCYKNTDYRLYQAIQDLMLLAALLQDYKLFKILQQHYILRAFDVIDRNKVCMHTFTSGQPTLNFQVDPQPQTIEAVNIPA